MNTISIYLYNIGTNVHSIHMGEDDGCIPRLLYILTLCNGDKLFE